MDGAKAKSGGGRLKLKGVAISKHSKKKKSKEQPASSCTDQIESVEEEVPVEVPEPQPGSGRIVSSGVTVHGFETKFREEVDFGDVIVLFHPKQLLDEERIVIAILSQRSLTLHEPFSSDIASTSAYRIRKDSILLTAKAEKVLKSERTEAALESGAAASSSTSKTKLQDEVSRQLQKKLDKTKATFSYREKTGMWGYRVVTEEVGKNLSAEDILDRRAKKMGRDKFCW